MGKRIKSNDEFDFPTECIISELGLIEIYKNNIEGHGYLSPIQNAEERRKTKIKLVDHLVDGGWTSLIPDYYHEAYKSYIIDLMEIVSEFEQE